MNDAYDLANRVVAEFNSTGGWNRGEVYAGSRHLATYADSTTYFDFGDSLGTERAVMTLGNSLQRTCSSDAWGSTLNCSGSALGSPNPIFLTGKPRDPETGLDNFGARYNASSLGRWMTPDWSAQAEPIPYAKLDNPQSLDLYTYNGNGPVTRVDKDGHCYPLCTVVAGAAIGAFVGAVAEVASEKFNNKGQQLDWTRIGNAAIAGAAAGAVAGLAGPEAGLAAVAGASSAGAIVGGVVARANDGKGSTMGEITTDAVIGAIGATASNLPAKVVSSQIIRGASEQVIDKGTDVVNSVIDGAGRNRSQGPAGSPLQDLRSASKQPPVTPSRPPLNCGGPALGGESDCPN